MKKFPLIFFLVVLTIVLYFLMNFNYLVFHTTIEVITFSICILIFIVSIISSRYSDSSIYSILGTGFLSVAIITIIHTIAYKGMGIVPQYDANLPTQMWIIMNYNLAIIFLYSFILSGKKFISFKKITFLNTFVSGIFIYLALIGYFPDCFIEGEGLTPFKRISEYVIIGLFLISLVLLIKNRKYIMKVVYNDLLISIILLCIGEFLFTLYIDVFGLQNFLGHIVRLYAFVFISHTAISVGITNPYESIFRELNFNSITDDLTGLYNRQYLFKKMEEITKDNNLNEYSFVIIDLDNFKKINDKYGHLTGDKVLVAFSNILKRSVRKYDVAGRFGGEEFVMLLNKCKPEMAYKIMKRIKFFVQKQYFTGQNIQITISCGISKLTKDINTSVAIADKYLYKAKSMGKNVIVYEEEKNV